MRLLFNILLLLCTAVVPAQPPAMELQPNGFPVITVPLPETLPEKLIDLTQRWAHGFNLKEEGFDATNITSNTITITANKKNAFFYRDRGQAFDHEIRYEMHFTFNKDNYTLKFNITDIYLRDRRLESGISDFFTSDGKLKDGYDGLERSLEASVNNIVRDHYTYILNYR